MEFLRIYPDASRIFATDILGGHANILKKLDAEVKPIVGKKCKLIASWIKRGHIRPVDPLNLFFISCGVTEYYANFASEISVFFDAKPMPEAAFDKSVQGVLARVMYYCQPIHY